MQRESWQRLSRAQEHYERFGFQYIDVPWTVEERIADITTPIHCSYVYYKDEILVGSAEQSFLQLFPKLDGRNYYAITPCFRDEKEVSALNRPYFMKLELFSRSTSNLEFIKNVAQMFFEKELGWRKKKNLVRDFIEIDTNTFLTDEDLIYKGIELGSYGYRKHKDMEWVYGTGLAEPRFSTAYSL